MDWWRQHEETQVEYTNCSTVALDGFSIIPQGVQVEAAFSLGWDFIGWRLSKTTGETLPKPVIIRLIARATTGISAGDDPLLDMATIENAFEMKREVAERPLLRMAKVHDFLEMWQSSRNLGVTQK